MKQLDKVLTWSIATVLFLVGISFFGMAISWYEILPHTSNWSTISAQEQAEALYNFVGTPVESALANFVGVVLCFRVRGLFLFFIWGALFLYGVFGFVNLSPHVSEWVGVLHGEQIATGGAQYAGHAVAGFLGIIQVILRKKVRLT